jgi:ankyrin repeat protein
MSGPPVDTGLNIGPGGPAAPALIAAAFDGDLDAVRRILSGGADVNVTDPFSGLSALHIAAGRDDLAMCRLLIDHNARFFADGFGRWPTIVAAECRVSVAVCDFIVEAEAAFLARDTARYS